jgi:hypothetical protein
MMFGVTEVAIDERTALVCAGNRLVGSFADRISFFGRFQIDRPWNGAIREYDQPMHPSGGERQTVA